MARAVHQETEHSRQQLHAVRYGQRCDATIRFTPRFVAHGSCPCVDEYVDALCLAWNYLRGLNPADVHSYVALARTHCRLRVVSDMRRRRVGRQSQQRPDRLAHGVIGRALGTDQQRALLVDIVREAGSLAPLHGDEQLLRRLPELRADQFGGSPESHVDGVQRGLAVVRDTARRYGARKRDSRAHSLWQNPWTR